MGERRVRIVGGEWRGRRIDAPQGELTRPTTDRVREAIFSALSARTGADLGGAQVLDAFAGSGALGLEALSRGAVHATFMERDRKALSALNANIAKLGATVRATVRTGDVFSLAGGRIGGPFSLILLDPPYKLDGGHVAAMLERLEASESVEDGACAVWEHAEGATVPWPRGWQVVTAKRYGSTEVDIAVFAKG